MVVPFAREIISQARLADPVLVQAGDFQQEGLGHGYHVALVFGVLNGEPPDGRPALIHKIYDCLDPGGLDTSNDWARRLAEAGFAQGHTIDLPAPTGTTLTVARKPA